MRKIFTIAALSLSLLGGSVFAAPQKRAKAPFNPEKPINELTFSYKGKTVKTRHDSSRLNTRDEENGPVVTPVITDPKGERVEYLKESAGITTNWMIGTYVYQGSNPSEVVWDGDDVYIKDIISDVDAGSYVKGTISGDKITLTLPQTIVFYDDMEFGYNLVMLKIDSYFDEEDGEEYIDYVLDDSITEVDFIMGEDGYFYLDLPGGFDGEDFPEHALGLVYTDVDPYYDGYFAGYCDFAQEYSVFEMESNVIPDGVTLETYVTTESEAGFGYTVNVGFDEDTIYLQGLSSYMPEGVVIGKMEKSGDNYIVKISQDQYVGLFENLYFIFTKAVAINPDYDEDDMDSEYLILAPEDAEVELIYNPETKTFTYGDSPYMLCLNTSLQSIYYLDLFFDINLKYQSEFSGVPSNPESLMFIPFAQYYGYDVFDFTLPNISTDGSVLDMDCMYYSIFIDGEIMEFQEEEGVDSNGFEVIMYEGLPEPTTIIPLTLNNGNDIWSSYNSAEIGIYFDGFTTIGVQSVYVYDGVTTRSAIVEFDIETGEITTSVGTIGNSPEIESVEFYDLNGRRISRPDNGIYIMRCKNSDGSTTVKKIVRK